MNDEQILKIFINSLGRIDSSKLRKRFLEKNIDIVQYLNNRFNDSDSYTETIYRIKNKIYEKPKCKTCGKPITYNCGGFNDFCSTKCSSLNPDVKNKLLKTCQEKYGVDHPLKSNLIRNKIKQTCLEKYGVDNPWKSDLIKEKIKQTCLEKYGSEYVSSTIEFRKNVKNTCLEKYGVDNPRKSDLIKKKIAEKKLINHGDKNFNNRELFKKTMIEKYGVEHALQYKPFLDKFNEHIINKLKDKCISHNIIFNNYNNNILNAHCDKCNNNFEINLNVFNIRCSTGECICTNCNPYKLYVHRSKYEDEVFDIVSSFYNGPIEKNKKFSFVIDGKTYNFELDLYLPEDKIGIEFNGLYWHSELYKEKNYHIGKKILFDKKYNINILNIWEDDWNNNVKKDIIIARLKNKLGYAQNKVYARKCIIKNINSCDSKHFLDDNHLMQNRNASIKLGMYYNDELLMVATFNNINEHKYELIRLCTKKNYIIIGGFSKIIQYFINEYKPYKIISYIDLDWSNLNNNSYNKIGFKLIKITKPDYFWIGNEHIRENRIKFQKHKLVKQGFDKNKTEDEIMHERNYIKLYGTGNLLVELDCKYLQ